MKMGSLHIFVLKRSLIKINRWWFQICFYFDPLHGEMIQFDDHIFQMGWFNHQLDKGCLKRLKPIWMASLRGDPPFSAMP